MALKLKHPGNGERRYFLILGSSNPKNVSTNDL
jgi:hypothetical protein